MNEKIERRRRDRRDQQAARFRFRRERARGGAPCGREGRRRREEGQRVHQADLRSQKFQDVARREIVRRHAGELLAERRPAVRRIPDHERGEDRSGEQSRRIGRRGKEPAAQRRRREQRQRDSGAEKRRGEFRQQREPEREADAEPAPRASAPDFDQRRQAEGPEDDERRVRRDDRRARDQRHRDPQQSGERGDRRGGEQPPGDPADQRGQGSEDRRVERANAEFAIPEERSRSANPDGDHRRMIEVAPREAPRPERVIGLVEGQLDASDQQELNRRHGEARSRRDSGDPRGR